MRKFHRISVNNRTLQRKRTESVSQGPQLIQTQTRQGQIYHIHFPFLIPQRSHRLYCLLSLFLFQGSICLLGSTTCLRHLRMIDRKKLKLSECRRLRLSVISIIVGYTMVYPSLPVLCPLIERQSRLDKDSSWEFSNGNEPAIIAPKKNPLISLSFSWWFLMWHWRAGPLDSYDIRGFPSFMSWKCGITPAFQPFSFEIWIKKQFGNRSNLFNLRVKIPWCAAFFNQRNPDPSKGSRASKDFEGNCFLFI